MADLEELKPALVMDEVTKARLAKSKGEEYEPPPEETPEDDEEEQVRQIDLEARLQEMERQNQEKDRKYQEQINQQNMVFQQQLAQVQELLSRQAATSQQRPENENSAEDDIDFDFEDEDEVGVNKKIVRFLTKSQKQNLKLFNRLQKQQEEQAQLSEQRTAELQEQFKYGWQLNFERDFKKHVQDLIDGEEVFAPLGKSKRHLVTEIMQKVRVDPEFQGIDNVHDLAAKHVRLEANDFRKEQQDRKAKSGAKKVKQKTSEELPPSSRGGATLPPGMENMPPEKLKEHRMRMAKDPAYRKAQSLAFIEGIAPQKG